MEVKEQLKKAKFGDKFRTRDGRTAIFLREIIDKFTDEHGYQFQVENEDEPIAYYPNGKLFGEAYPIDEAGNVEEYGIDIVSKALQYAYQLTRTIFDYEPDVHAKYTVKTKVLYFANRKDAENFRKVDHKKEHKGYCCIFPPMSEYVNYEIKKIKIQ